MPSVSDLTSHRLLTHVAAAQTAGRAPSVVAGVVRDGELAWVGSYGDVPGAPDDTQYRIGSITKTITAVLVLQLVRDGLLRLDQPARDVLGDVGYADRTVRQLLAHSSGMQAEPVGSWWERSAGQTWAELTAGNDGSTPAFAAGDRFHYSNLGFALLGEIAARVIGSSWMECVQARVLDPLGLTRTSYLATGTAAQGYSVDPYAGTLREEPATDTGAMAPAGQLWSTVSDLARYAGFLLDGDPDVLSARELAAAFTPQSGDPEDGVGYAHGLGFAMYRGGSGTLVGHTGSMPGFLASCLVDRRHRTGAVTLANTSFGPGTSDLATALLEELERTSPSLPAPWVPSPPPPPEVTDVLGLWHWGNTPLVFSWEGDEIVGRRAGVERFRFRVEGGRVVGSTGYHAGEEIRVGRDAAGAITHLDIATFILTRTPYDPRAPIPGE